MENPIQRARTRNYFENDPVDEKDRKSNKKRGQKKDQGHEQKKELENPHMDIRKRSPSQSGDGQIEIKKEGKPEKSVQKSSLAENPFQRARTRNYFENNPLDIQKQSSSQTKDSRVEIKKSDMPEKSVKNGSLSEDEKIMKLRRTRNAVIFGSAGIALLFLVVIGFLGIEFYDTYLKKIATEKVVKGEVNVVLKINTDVDFEQYQLLDEHLKKFPGYELLEKELDETGKGKSPSQFIQDKLKENNLNFQNDIRPVLGQDLYVLIPNLESLEKNLWHRMAFLKDNTNALLNRQAEEHRIQKGFLAQSEISQSKDESKVLGTTTDYYAMNKDVPKMEPLDFIIASQIKDLKEAKRVLNKIKLDKSTYKVKETKLKGYIYYQIENLKCKSDKTVPFDVNTTYHALIGRNWVMSTNENDLKEMIRQRKKDHVLTMLKGPFIKKTQEMMVLENSCEFKNVMDEIAPQKEKGIILGYFKVNFKKFFDIPQGHEESYGYSPTKYFKYPEKFVFGFLFKVEQSGIALRSVSNQVSLKNAAKAPYTQGLVEKIPTMVDGRFTDVYFENENVKDLYYNFKENNLTKEGLDEWNKIRKEVDDEVGIDFERDIIDQLNGNVAAALFAKRELEPEGAIIAEIENKERIVESARKMIEMVKTAYIGMLSIGSGSSLYMPQQQENIGDYSINSYYPGTSEDQEQMNALIETIRNSQLTETQTEQGTIYSYKLPETSFSFDFGFSGNILILGSHFAATKEIMGELANGSVPKLADDENYRTVSSYIFPEGYSKLFVNTFGVWNMFEYYFNQFGLFDQQEDKDMFFAIGAIVRTINLIGSVNATSQDEQSAKSSVYFNIKELPKEVKDRAECLLEE